MPLTASTVAVLGEYLTPTVRRERPDTGVSASVVALPARTTDGEPPTQRHPRPNDANAPLFPNPRSSGTSVGGRTAPRHGEATPFDRIAPKGLRRAGQRMTPVEQAAALTVQEAGERLPFDWAEPIHHKVYYKRELLRQRGPAPEAGRRLHGSQLDGGHDGGPRAPVRG